MYPPIETLLYVPSKLRPGRLNCLLNVAAIFTLCSCLSSEPPETRSPRITLTAHRGYVACIAVAPNSKTFASTGDDGAVKIWDVQSGKEQPRLADVPGLYGNPRSCNCVAYSPDGKRIAAGGVNDIVVWDLETGEKKAILKPPKFMNFGCLVFGNDSRTLFSGSAPEKSVLVWDVETATEKARWHGHKGVVNCLALSPDGKTLASASPDKTIQLWEVTTGNVTATLQAHTPNTASLAFSPDGRLLASAATDPPKDKPPVRVWDVSTSSLKSTYRVEHYREQYVSAVSFSPDQKFLACCTQSSRVHIWEVSSGKKIAILMPDKYEAAYSLAFPSQPKTLVVAYGGGLIRIWDIPDR